MPRLTLAAALLMLTGTASAYEPTWAEIWACAPDYLRLCSQVPLEDKRAVGRCMRAHRAELKPACRKAFAAHGL